MTQAMIALLAHAGPHEPTTGGLLHALTEPDHVLAGAGLLLVALAAVSVYRHVKSRGAASRAGRES